MKSCICLGVAKKTNGENTHAQNTSVLSRHENCSLSEQTTIGSENQHFPGRQQQSKRTVDAAICGVGCRVGHRPQKTRLTGSRFSWPVTNSALGIGQKKNSLPACVINRCFGQIGKPVLNFVSRCPTLVGCQVRGRRAMDDSAVIRWANTGSCTGFSPML